MPQRGNSPILSSDIFHPPISMFMTIADISARPQPAAAAFAVAVATICPSGTEADVRRCPPRAMPD